MGNRQEFSEENLVIGIIGFGPKGLYGLERLLANYMSEGSEKRVTIHVFNKNDHFGSGAVYRTDQPSYLLMNYANIYIDMWSRTDPKPIVENPLNLTSWYTNNFGGKNDEIDTVNAPRKVVGEYLKDGFRALLDKTPESVLIIQHILEIDEIEKNEGHYFLTGTNEVHQKVSIPYAFDKLLVTTGHQTNISTTPNKLQKALKEKHINFVYPVQSELTPITKNSTVAVKGLGLTFIDTMLALTEGRGGEFIENEGVYEYCRSGQEPKILYPFSLSGLPMIPRAPITVNDHETGEPLYFRQAYLKSMQNKEDQIKVDFRTSLLPAIQKDIQFAYYQKLFELKNDNLVFDEEYGNITKAIEKFHQRFPEEPFFGLQTLMHPIDHELYDHDIVIAYIKNNLLAIENYGAQTPIQLAASVWRKISPLFNEIYSFGGLTAESQEDFDTNFAGHFNRIAYGAPVINMKKLVALADSGIINFSFGQSPNLSVFEEKGTVKLTNDRENFYRHCDYLVDARIPKTNIRVEKTQLFSKLCKKDLACEFVNSSNDYQYKPGCLTINSKGHPIHHDGQIEENITLYGTPTEGITFDNDTLSRTRNDFASRWAKNIIRTTTLISV